MAGRTEGLEATIEHYVELRRAVDRHEKTWADFADFFTEDAVYVDPAWGRVEGRSEIVRLVFSDAMAGIEDWTFPIDFVMTSGDTVVMKWRQVIPVAGAEPLVQSGVSTMIYAGSGRFRYQEDLLNMVHVLGDLKTSGWRPVAGMHAPPHDPVRDFAPPGGYPLG